MADDKQNTNKKVKALAVTNIRTNISLVFMPIRNLDIKEKGADKYLKSVQIGELISNSTLKMHDSAICIGDWIFCIEILTEEGRKVMNHYVDEGVICAYYKEDFYYTFRPIKIDKDPRKEYLDWFVKNIYPLFN
jgi:hypothetical protein